MDWQSFGIGVCVGMLLWITLYWSIHNRRPTKRAPDVCPSCAGDKQVIGEDGTVWVCGICGGTGKRG